MFLFNLFKWICNFSFHPNRQEENVRTLVGGANRAPTLCWRRRRVKEDLSLLVVLCSDSGTCTVGASLEPLLLNVKVINRPPAPVALVERTRAKHGWVMAGTAPVPPTPHPPSSSCSLGRQRRSAAPTLLFSLCQVLRMESGGRDRSSVTVLQEPVGFWFGFGQKTETVCL